MKILLKKKKGYPGYLHLSPVGEIESEIIIKGGILFYFLCSTFINSFKTKVVFVMCPT